MDEQLYFRFEEEQKLGLKARAKETIVEFVASFTDFSDKRAWAQKFMSARRTTYAIRHELYEEVIFPVLFEGYQRKDPKCLYWLARTAQNLYKSPRLHERIDQQLPIDLLKQAYSIAPDSEEFRQGLLEALIDGLRWITHEWPAGILYEVQRPWHIEYWDLMQDLKLARELDRAASHVRELDEIEEWVTQDRNRRAGK
jgi:hypothetical protein